jgi:hypothetical protein
MSRSHQRDDQEARERQMQQDIESAMSMCESELQRYGLLSPESPPRLV